jgi:predicted secreted Zn-dependent protease
LKGVVDRSYNEAQEKAFVESQKREEARGVEKLKTMVRDSTSELLQLEAEHMKKIEKIMEEQQRRLHAEDQRQEQMQRSAGELQELVEGEYIIASMKTVAEKAAFQSFMTICGVLKRDIVRKFGY